MLAHAAALDSRRSFTTHTQLLVDLRQHLSPDEMSRAGFTYVSVGRPAVEPR